MRTTWHTTCKVTLATLVVTLLFAGCSTGGSDTTTTDTTDAPAETTVIAADTTATTTAISTEMTAFCDEIGDPSAEVPESYVGSAEQIEDLQRARAVSPDELQDDLDTIIGYFEAEVDPADPESQLIENFPDEIVEATDRVTAFTEEHCGA